ncbi:hypothetical protein Gasu2_17630 [Galdieria sulphuraria]|nr:hypothetical protein Gasu2_17630 [Galdieria sulphuraria]
MNSHCHKSSASNTDFLALLSRELLNRIQRLSEGFSIACQKELLKSFQGTNNCKGLRTALNQAAQSSYGQVQGNISHETSNNSGFFTANGNSRIAASNSTESSPASSSLSNSNFQRSNAFGFMNSLFSIKKQVGSAVNNQTDPF